MKQLNKDKITSYLSKTEEQLRLILETTPLDQKPDPLIYQPNKHINVSHLQINPINNFYKL